MARPAVSPIYSMTEQAVPEGSVVREDGCICPEEKKKACNAKYTACPYDPRFPNQNITKRCYFSFIDYQRCRRLLGKYPGCDYFLRCYLDLCPKAWISTWYEQMENKTFPTPIYPPGPIYRGTFSCVEQPEEEEEPAPPSPPC